MLHTVRITTGRECADYCFDGSGGGDNDAINVRDLHVTRVDQGIGKTENGDADDAVATEALLHRTFAEQGTNKMILRRKFCVTLSWSAEGTPRRWLAEMGRRETTE